MVQYFDGAVKEGYFKFLTARTFVFISGAFSGLFIPIFLYELFGNSMHSVVIYYASVSFLYFLLLPKSGFLNNIGFKKSLTLSIFAAIIYYSMLFFSNNQTFLIFIPLAIIFLSLFRFMFWMPYHTDFAKLTDSANRGRQFGLMLAILSVISIITPIISGFVADNYGLNILFIISIIMLLFSGYFFSKTECIYEEFTWSYKKTWKVYLKNIKNRKLLAFVGDGMESIVSLYIWPVFIFILLEGNLLEVGIITSVITFVVAILQLLAGKYIDKHKGSKKLLKTGTALYSIGWLFKIFVLTAFEIFLAGVYHQFTAIFTKTPYQVEMYEIAADQGHYIDEYTVVREMAINIGRVLMCAIVFVLLFTVSIKWVFLLAAGAILLLNFIKDTDIDLRREGITN